MTRGKKIGLAILGIVLLAGGAAVTYWVKEPLAILASLRRQALDRAGFERVEIPNGEGKLLVFTKGPAPTEGPSGEPAPTLVFFHGVGNDAGTWSAVAPVLAESFRVILVDLPGHGGSEPATGPLEMARVIAGAASAVRFAGPRPVTVVGNSLGGWLAFLVAENQPDLVERIVVIGGGPLAGEPGPSLVPTSRDEAAALMARVRDSSAPALPGYVLDDLIERAGSGPIARLSADVPGLVAALWDEERLTRLQTPTDLLWGTSDGIVPPSYAERLARLIPRVRLELLESCGHIPQLECPERFLAALQQLLSAGPPLPVAAAAAEPESLVEMDPAGIDS